MWYLPFGAIGMPATATATPPSVRAGPPQQSPGEVSSGRAGCTLLLLTLYCAAHLLMAVHAVLCLTSGPPPGSHCPELLTLAICGVTAAGLAVLAVWAKIRLLLVPLVLFLVVTLILDLMTLFYFILSGNSFNSIENLNPSLAPFSRHSSSFLFVIKFIVSCCLLRLVILLYRKNLLMRTGRSPFRSASKPPTPPPAPSREAEKGKSLEQANLQSPELKPPKVGQYRRFSGVEYV